VRTQTLLVVILFAACGHPSKSPEPVAVSTTTSEPAASQSGAQDGADARLIAEAKPSARLAGA
jgi:hypothetical protein